jgi:hypothetical protein
MFAGTSGSGVKDMPSEHSKIMTTKCIECHTYNGKAEADKTPSEKGGHTFRLDDRVCLKCHDNPAGMIAEWSSKISPLVAQLKDLLDKYPNKSSKIYYAAKRNYAMVTSDNGMQTQGIHNPKYALALLQSSISELTAESTWKMGGK